MVRIIPGVQVNVVKEVVPPQLAPSGVLGIVGFAEKQPDRIKRAASWTSFVEVFGAASAYAIPEARQALENGVFELVISPITSSTAAAATVKTKANVLVLTARVMGSWANSYSIHITARKDEFDLAISKADGTPEGLTVEVHKKLTMVEGSPKYAGTVLQQTSALINVTSIKAGTIPETGSYDLAGGKDASPTDYDASLAALENEPDVDMVLASIQDFSSENSSNVTKIYSKVIAHCERMSSDSKGRIGFGQILPGSDAADAVDKASNLVSDRFVMVAPHGVVGAVTGRVGSINYFRSPTFKTLAGLGELNRVLGLEEQRELLKGNIVPIISQRGRGVIVVRGLTTDGDQISVRRTADHAVRGVKMLGDLFIGRLNNEDGRNSLKQKLIEFLVQMEKESAIVPSTDGLDPAFKVDVYSSQADFAKGIVRVDMAVRPVRAIDYIYATILVQV